MKNLNNLTKRLGSAFMTSLIIDSYISSKKKDSAAEALADENLKKQKIIEVMEQRLDNNANQKVEVTRASLDLETTSDNLSLAVKKLNETKARINNNTFNPGENKEMAEKTVTRTTSEITKLTEKQVEQVKELTKILSKASIFEYYNNFIEIFISFLSILNSDQILAVLNIILHYTTLSTLNSILLILFGEYLITKFKLAERFPKINKYILYKNKINQNLLKYNVILAIIIVIISILINFYILIYNFIV